MDKIIKKALFIALCYIFYFCSGSFAADLPSLPPLNKEDRILILAPHPDDEGIACSGLIQEALKNKAQVEIVYLTNGDNNEVAFIIYEKRLVFRKSEFIRMGELRRKEAIEAMGFLGLNTDKFFFLGYPDFGTFTMFTRFWKSPVPFKSMLTRVTKVPYKENLSYGSSYLPENILADLEKLIEDYKPNKIFVSYPADRNRDHRALNLFLAVSLWDLEGKMPLPKVYNYLVHHFGWPSPLKYHPEDSLYPPDDMKDLSGWASLELSQDEVDKKYQAILNYKSQTESSAFYLLAFARRNELFQETSTLNLASGDTVSLDGYARYMLKDNQVNIILKHLDGDKDISRVGIYLFGWRSDVAFADMPKIFLSLRAGDVSAYNGKNPIKIEGVSQVIENGQMIIKVPLLLLNSPQKALVSVRIFSKDVPYVQSIWNQLKFK